MSMNLCVKYDRWIINYFLFLSEMQTPYGDACELLNQYMTYKEECEHAQITTKIRTTVMKQ